MATKNYLETAKSISKKDGERIENSTGVAYNYKVDDLARLDRFLLLGTSGGTFYSNEQSLTKENAAHVIECFNKYGTKAVDRIVEVSTEGLAPKQQPAIFALAIAAAHNDVAVRKAALEAMPQVCRTASTLFQFLEYVTTLRGWGRTLKRSVRNWYNDKAVDDLVYQIVKYRNRNGWTHKDALQLSHALPGDSISRKRLYDWVYDENSMVEEVFDENLRLLYNYEDLQRATDSTRVVEILKSNRNIPFEAIPNHFLKDESVWKQLVSNGLPMTAALRNLARLSSLRVTDDAIVQETLIEAFEDERRIQKSRLHPMNIYNALINYQSGQNRNMSWLPNRRIIDALDGAFYKAFKNVTPSNKRILVAVDVSGSMSTWKANGFDNMTAAQASAAMSLVTVATEPQSDVIVFDSSARWSTISPAMRLDTVYREFGWRGGATDCSAPYKWIIQNDKKYDAVVMYTDSETNVESGYYGYGYNRPNENYVYDALDAVRGLGPRDMKAINVAMSANDLTFSRETDVNTLDVAGFGADTPQAISLFVAGKA